MMVGLSKANIKELTPDKLKEIADYMDKNGYYISSDFHIRNKKGVLASLVDVAGRYFTYITYENKIYRIPEEWLKSAIYRHDDLSKVMDFDEIKPHPVEKWGLNSYHVATLCHVLGYNDELKQKLLKGVEINVETPNDCLAPSDMIRLYPHIVNYTRNHSLGDEELKNYLLGLNGECGELTDIFKKIFYHDKTLEYSDIVLEIGDIMFYLTAICNIMGISLTDVMLNNNAKLLARYENGFSVKSSQNRIEEEKN